MAASWEAQQDLSCGRREVTWQLVCTRLCLETSDAADACLPALLFCDIAVWQSSWLSGWKRLRLKPPVCVLSWLHSKSRTTLSVQKGPGCRR